jgi:peptidoglycan/LPS O-acetylase OafA/YrhL
MEQLMTRPAAKVPRNDAAGATQHRPCGTPTNIAPVTAAVRNRDFVGALESVRGLAALTVLIFHSALFLRQREGDPLEKTLWALKSTEELLKRLVTIAFNGHLAVSLFFVLSGFVLGLSLRRDDRSFARQAGGFFGRRFFRIYPALAVNLLVTVVIISILASAFPRIAYSSSTLSQLAENLLLYKFSVNGATWTLLIELLAIPLLLVGYLLAIRFGTGGMLMLAVATIILLFIPGSVHRILPGESLYFVRAFIVDYQFMFVFGMLVAEFPMRDRLRNQSCAVKIAMVVALVAMLSARFLLGYSSRWSLLTEGAAAAALVGLLAWGPRLAVHNLLDEWTPIRFLGRISYSLYLYHATALAMLIPATVWYMTASGVKAQPFLASLIIATTATVITIPLAWLSYNLVERPMMQLGRRL